jgi:hypothetical protein
MLPVVTTAGSGWTLIIGVSSCPLLPISPPPPPQPDSASVLAAATAEAAAVNLFAQIIVFCPWPEWLSEI